MNNPMEFMLKIRWQDLFYRHHDPGTAPKKRFRTWPETTLFQMSERLKKAADTLEKVEQARKIIEEASKRNGGLPF